MRKPLILAVLICAALAVLPACANKPVEKVLPRVDPKLELDTRLAGVDFSIVKSDPEAVESSWRSLSLSTVLPEQWRIEFAGATAKIPSVDPSQGVGIRHTDGRCTVVYLFPDIKIPEYGKFEPLALAHYIVPETHLDIVLLLVCFQSDPQGSLAGLAVRSLDPQGMETSVPFAIAAGSEELRGKFFYDRFLDGTASQAIAGRTGWDRGFMLLTRFDADTVLSTYLAWF